MFSEVSETAVNGKRISYKNENNEEHSGAKDEY